MEWNSGCSDPECKQCPNDCIQMRSRQCFDSNGGFSQTSLCEVKLGTSREIELCGCPESPGDRGGTDIVVVTEMVYTNVTSIIYENSCQLTLTGWYYCWWIWLIILLIIILLILLLLCCCTKKGRELYKRICCSCKFCPEYDGELVGGTGADFEKIRKSTASLVSTKTDANRYEKMDEEESEPSSNDSASSTNTASTNTTQSTGTQSTQKTT